MTVTSQIFELLQNNTGFVNPIDTSASGASLTESSQALDILMNDPAKMAQLQAGGITVTQLQDLQSKLSEAQNSCNSLNSYVGENISQMQTKLSTASAYTGIMKRMGQAVEPCSASSSIFGIALGQGALVISSIGETAGAITDLVNSEIENVQEWVQKFNGLVASVVAFPSSVQSMINDEIAAFNDILSTCVNGAFASMMATVFGEECSKAVIGTLASPEMLDLLNQFG